MAHFVEFEENIQSLDGRVWERFAILNDYYGMRQDFSIDIANIHYVYESTNAEYEYAKFDVTTPEEDVVVLIDDCCGYRQWGLYATGKARKSLQDYPILNEEKHSLVEDEMHTHWLYEWAPNIRIGNWDYYDIINKMGEDAFWINVEAAERYVNKNVNEFIPMYVLIDGQDKYGRPNYLGDENIDPNPRYIESLEEEIVKNLCAEIRQINRAKIYERTLKWKENWLTLPVGGDV